MLSGAGALWVIRREALEAWLVMADVVLSKFEEAVDGGRSSRDKPLADVVLPSSWLASIFLPRSSPQHGGHTGAHSEVFGLENPVSGARYRLVRTLRTWKWARQGYRDVHNVYGI